MDSEKIKRIFPFLKDKDLDDPKTKKKIGLACVGIAAVIALLILNSMPTGEERRQRELLVEDGAASKDEKTALLEIPNGEDHEILDAENMIAARERLKNGRSRNLRDLYVTGTQEDPLSISVEESDDTEAKRAAELDAIVAAYNSGNSEDVQAAPASRPAPAQTPVKKTKPVNRGGDAAPSGEEPKPAGTEPALPAEEPVSAAQPAARSTGGISSLDDWGTVDGISGLDSEDQYVIIDDSKPVRVMFVREQKISSGQRVALRLLDDIAAEGVLIPKNTHVMAQCSIGERMQLTVANIEINGKILSLGYTAFDNDGNEGLYCPESKEKRAAKQTRDQSSSIGTSLLSGALSSLAGNVVSSGTSIVQSNGNTKTAQVSAGYTFYLLKDDY